MSAYALTGGLVFDGQAFVRDQAVLVRGERVAAVSPEAGLIPRLAPDLARVPVDGALVVPGFVDLQVNGCAGVMFNSAITRQGLEAMRAGCRKGGCTAFLPTLISAPDADMEAAMAVVSAFRRDNGAGTVLGLHLEGPFISRERRGIHPEPAVRPLTPAWRDRLAAYARHTPLMLTLAPECVDEGDIRVLARAGVLVSLGHSAASYEQCLAAARAGASLVTHLFNAMPPWQGREPGLAGAALALPELRCGLIADGLHLHGASLALVKGIKGQNCFLATDGTAASASEVEEFDFCGERILVRDGRCVNVAGTLGGSSLTMLEAVRGLTARAGVPLEESLRMASLYPAAIMGRDGDFGRVAAGLYADLALLSPSDYSLRAVVDKGALYSRA